MNLENEIKDVISKKLEEGIVEKVIAEQLELCITNSLKDLTGRYGDVTKAIEDQLKSVLVPYLENYDYSPYIIKLDTVLVDVLKNASFENKALLSNFKELMQVDTRKEIKLTELFNTWKDYVSKNVETSGLEVVFEDNPSYEGVEVTMDIEYNEERDWSAFKHATLIFECEHDETMNFEVSLMRYKKEETWSMHYIPEHDMRTLRGLKEFEIMLMKFDKNNINLIVDIDSGCDKITPDQEPEPSYN